jgi:16S rRNA (cytidine1402-2'-O)-methyltransferase
MSTLHLVATPIGNLKDISFRALEVLKTADYILAEDTRKTARLLLHFKISGRTLISYFEANEQKRIPQVMNWLSREKSVALVTNAGTPLISDPGYKLVKEAIDKDYRVESIPGASAVLTGLIASGLPTDKFLFLGFLPKKPGKKTKVLENLKKASQFLSLSVVLYISPYKLIKDLTVLKEVFGDFEIVIGRELTKLYEEIRREKISESLLYFQKHKPKGELVVMFYLSSRI